MSHNKITVDNNSPSSAGDIPVNLSSYINETSPANNQVIKYDGANWINSPSPSGVGMDSGVGLILQNSAGFNGSGTYSVGDYLMIMKVGSRTYRFEKPGYVLDSATATNTIKSNNNWMESITVPGAGTYLFICTLSIEGGDMRARWESNAGGFSNYVHVDSTNNSSSGAVLLGILTTTGTDTARVVVQSQNSASGLTNDDDHRGLSVHVIELS
jgi:hypothetical protein